MKIVLFCMYVWMSFGMSLACFSSGAKTQLEDASTSPPAKIGEGITEKTPVTETKKNAQPSYVWQGSTSFADFWCGVPDSSYIQDIGNSADDNANRRRRRQAANTERVVNINTYSLDHSFVYFRGESYEFGPGYDLIYARGGVSRSPADCPITWSYHGQSACTREESEELASWYQDHYEYNLLLNNCHHFAEWLMQRLVSNKCTM